MHQSTSYSSLSPCPFSKAYNIPVKQAWFLLKGFYTYRLILAAGLFSLYFSRLGSLMIVPTLEALYLYTSLIYIGVTLVGWSLIVKPIIHYAAQAQLFVFSDIVLLTLIMHSCGGVSSGLGALMLVPTAAGGLLIGGRCAMLFAAIASLFVFAEQAYTFRIGTFKNTDYPHAGMLGAGFFLLALLSYILAKRTEQTELLSSQRQEAIISLEELNQYIIHNMPSGIIITDQQQKLNRCNNACTQLLGLTHLPHHLTDISPKMALAFERWLATPENDFISLSLEKVGELHIHFHALPTQHQLFFMITLEDVALYNQRVQQSKLASIGKLTASIAHEIRNPLGAISHAGQLLAECPDLSPQDIRLTEIIQMQSLRMNTIIEEVLQLSRKPEPEKEVINLASWLKNYFRLAINSQQGYENQFHLSLDSGVDLVLFDAGHLTQILNNLCANALKYGYVVDKQIQLHLFQQRNQPCIQVIDYGQGVAEKIQAHLFEPFMTSSHSGTGLGLYISRDLAELNQGKLSYQPNISGQGCSFRLCLPSATQHSLKL